MHILDFSWEDIRIFAIEEAVSKKYVCMLLLKPNKLNTLL